MKFIVKLKDKLSDHQLHTIQKYCSKILYVSTLLPLIGVESNDITELMGLDFIERIRPSEIGVFHNTGDFLTTIIFKPPLKKSILVKNSLLGWGNTRVAIIDSGVNGDNITECIDFSNTGHFDNRNHGTIIAAIIKHFAPGCQLYSAKVGNQNPDELNVMQALEWAVLKGAHIINLSSGFERKKRCRQDCELCLLVNEITKKGIAVVVAAGNNNNIKDSIDCPGVVENAVTVSAIDEYDKKVAHYVSLGKPGVSKPNILAPGWVSLNGSCQSGTSFAAPIISGLLAAVKHRIGNINKAIEYIYNTAEDLDLPSYYQGHGYINIEKFVEVILNETTNIESSGQNQSS